MEGNKSEVKSRNGVIAFLLILVLIFASLFTATAAYIVGYERGNKAKADDKSNETSVTTDTNKEINTATDNKNKDINATTNETTKTESNATINNDVKIVKKLSPSGWAGSSMQEIRLYSNGEVYHVVYSGAGTTDNDIVSSELIAKNADTIEEKMAGQAVDAIIVKGKNLEQVGENNNLWIIFEKN